jgi:hypothetical protein
VSDRRAVAELLHALAAALAEVDAPWYLFGAQAAIMWGSPRLSADVDVTVTIEPQSMGLLIESMRRHGFDAIFNDPEFVARARVIPFIHRGSRMPLDVVLAGPGLEEEFFRRAIQVDVNGTLIPVISPEDLIATKTLAGRAKDIEDIRAVLHAQQATIDVTRIRRILGLLQQALAQSDLLPLFEKEWRDAAELTKMPAAGSRGKSSAPRKKK